MIKKDLVSRATAILHDKDVRKDVPAIKSKLHIRDEDGNESQIVIRKEPKGYLFNESDVSAILDALCEAVVDGLREGQGCMLYNMGSIDIVNRAARTLKRVDGGGMCTVPEHLVPKFTCGKALRMAVKIYEAGLKDGADIPVPMEEEEDGD